MRRSGASKPWCELEASKDDTLVTDQPRGAIDWMRVTPLDLEVRLATGHEEAAGFAKAIEALEVEETTIHDVEGAGLGQQLVEDVDLMHLAITDVNAYRFSSSIRV
jgi:hypothetical protein